MEINTIVKTELVLPGVGNSDTVVVTVEQDATTVAMVADWAAELVYAKRKVQAIKLARKWLMLGLREAKYFVEAAKAAGYGCNHYVDGGEA